jgi:CRP/FNR family transcriptional regulator, cyclic AMP receptor protein
MARKLAEGFDVGRILAKVGSGRTISQYRKKQSVFVQGDPADSIFYVRTGRVKLSVVSARGKSAVVAMIGPGEFFGEGCLAGQPLRMATASTMTEALVVRIGKKSMVEMLAREPEFSAFFLSYLLSRTVRMEEDLVDQLFNSSEMRLARILLLLAQFGKDGKSELVVPKISQETLAEMIGTTRPRVNGFMNKFRKLGFIEYNGELRVHSSLINLILHDSENVPL